METDLTLYRLESDMAALADTEEAGVPAELQEAFRQELGAYTEAALAKRDGCARFVAFLEGQIELAKAEETRLYDRRKRLENGLGRFKRYVLDCVVEFASKMTKGPPKLEGRTCTLVAVRNPQGAEVVDAQQLPVDMIHVEIRIPGTVWAGLPADVQDTLKRQAVSYAIAPQGANILSALRSGRVIPGARLKPETIRLAIR